MRRKLIDKIATKKHQGKCNFCDVDDYQLLDVHRISPGAEGGVYSAANSVVVCSNCHRKIHAGKIKIDRKYFSSSGTYVIHCWIETDGELCEFWLPEP